MIDYIKLKNNIKKEILWRLPRTLGHKILYKEKMNKKLNLSNPKDLNEKIHYLLIYRYKEKETKCTDKYLVREYIVKKGLGELLPKLYGAYNSFQEIDFNSLPSKFVLKTNHSCGDVYICLDKKNFDIESARKVLSKKLKENYAKKKLEYHYSKIKPKIICEEYIDDGSGKMPKDYKFFCFNGKVYSILVCSNRSIKVEQNWYDIEWNELDYVTEKYKNNIKHEKPKNLDKMVKVAEELSSDFKFVRVDLYNANGKIFFGELTFSPAAGFIRFVKPEILEKYGSLINL